MNVIDTIAQKSPHLSWIKDNTIYLARHGSHAYGTNMPSSDEDYRGICIPPIKYYTGFINSFEQAELKAPDPDTTIFSLRKFFNLASDCNPNTLEILFVESEDIIYINDIGRILLENRNDFLSKKIKFTMCGYAVSQLNRIKLHHRYLLNPVTSYPTRAELGLPERTLIPQDQLLAAQAEVQKELDRYQLDFLDNLEYSQRLGLKEIVSQMLAEMKITADQQWLIAARKIGMDDNFIHLMQLERQYVNAKRDYDQYQNWKKTRNKTRAELEAKFLIDTKHVLHLVRLLRTCKEVITTGKLQVRRPDAEELLAIRNGAWTYEQVIEYANKMQKETDELYLTSNTLPKAPDKEKLDQLCVKLTNMSLNRKV